MFAENSLSNFLATAVLLPLFSISAIPATHPLNLLSISNNGIIGPGLITRQRAGKVGDL